MGPRTGVNVLVNKVAANPMAVPLKVGDVVAEEIGFVLACRVEAVGGTKLEGNAIAVLEAPLMVKVPTETPPKVTAALAVVPLA